MSKTLTQLDPVIVLNTPKGKAVAHFLIDYGYEHDLYWVCFQHDTGQCWTWSNKDITIDNNVTIGRNVRDKLVNLDDVSDVFSAVGKNGKSKE